jgi:hypothetical protein
VVLRWYSTRRRGGLRSPRVNQSNRFGQSIIQHSLMPQVRFQRDAGKCRGGPGQQFVIETPYMGRP